MASCVEEIIKRKWLFHLQLKVDTVKTGNNA